MRRLPIYILLDTSGSMRGEPIEALRVGMETLLASLRRDPYALETAWLSAITFDLEARVLVPLTEVANFVLPEIPVPVTSPTNLGAGLELLIQRYRAEVERSTRDHKGDWSPILVVMTDGRPSDTALFQKMAAEIKSMRFAKIVACAAGPRAKVEPLKSLTPEVYSLETMDAAAFAKFWTWISTSIGAQSRSVGATTSIVDELPPPPPEIQLVM